MILADRALAEDAVQQAFIRLLGRGQVDDVASMRAFLRVIVRHEAYRLLAARRVAPIQPADAPLLEVEVKGEVEAADAPMQRREQQQQLERALRQLPPDQREVVHLKVYEQLSFAEIAQLLAISPNTAASRYRYAIGHLREFLASPRSVP